MASSTRHSPPPPPAHRGRARPPPPPSASRPAARQRSGAPRSGPPRPSLRPARRRRRRPTRPRVHRWAADTWHSLVAMTDAKTGLPADNITESLAAGDRSGYTSPTNIGGYLWSAVVARDLGIITRGECTRRLVPDPQHAAAHGAPRAERHVLQLVRRGHRRGHHDLARATATASTRSCSSVDNGWLGAALHGRAVTPTRAPHRWPSRLFGRMRWDMFYDPDTAHPGCARAGSSTAASTRRAAAARRPLPHGNHIGVGPDVWYTNHHYDTTVSETRITSYLGILTGQIPAKQYFAMWRTFPATCDWSWHEMQPVGAEPHLPGRRRLRGRLHLPRHAHRPGLGRQHVRGAHARRVRARVELGAAQLGPQPPAARPRPARARPHRGGLRLLGLLARRATPSAATASTASTRSA